MEWQRRKFGNTGAWVCPLGFGTVELGTHYGYGAVARRIDRAAAEAMVRAAVAMGIDVFDTSPSYGSSESILGSAETRWQERVILATKLPPQAQLDGLEGGELSEIVKDSLESSSRLLHRRPIDLVQLHNPSAETLRQCQVMRLLEKARQDGLVRWIGATICTASEAEAVLASQQFQTLQAPLHLLNLQRMSQFATKAEEQGVAFIARSVYLRGLLTSERSEFPEELRELSQLANQLEDFARARGMTLPEIALRAVLSQPGVSVALVGMRSEEMMQANLKLLEAGPLDAAVLRELKRFDRSDDPMIDPRNWPTEVVVG